MGPMGELGALFNPGMRHEIEERESKQNRREEEGNARDGDLRIDLASGVAVINIPGRSTPENGLEADATAARPAGSQRESSGDRPAARTVGDKPAARTVGDKPAAPAAARPRSARAADRAAQTGNSDRRKERPSAAPAPGTAGSTAIPSSKASRAAR